MKIVRSIENDPKHLEKSEHEQFIFGGPLLTYRYGTYRWDKVRDVFYSLGKDGNISAKNVTSKLQDVKYDQLGNPFIVHIDDLGFSDTPMIEWCPAELLIKKTPEGHFIGGYGDKFLKEYGHLSAKEYVSEYIINSDPNLYVEEV